MRAFVFGDESLKEQAGRFVWLAIDTEKETNAKVEERFPIDAWPTLLVIDPKDERVALRWVGGATAPQLRRILEDGRLAVLGGALGEGPEPAFARAERLYGQRSFAEAAKAYQESLKAAPAEWPRYSRAVESLLFALSSSNDCTTALQIAQATLPRLRGTPSALSVAGTGLECAMDLPKADAGRRDSVAFFEKAAREAIADPKLLAAADDRSSLYADLVRARKDAKDEAGTKACAAEWATFLEGEAAKAKTPEARAVFDAHRLSAYIELGEPQRAIPMLEASERDFPQDYNPPARLGVALRELKRWDEALAATDRALARAYGPRKIRILLTRSDILLGRGDQQGARTTLAEALSTARALPPGQRSEPLIASVQKKLSALPQQP
jgi:tetratricopeptide (TPR) repeat protein